MSCVLVRAFVVVVWFPLALIHVAGADALFEPRPLVKTEVYPIRVESMDLNRGHWFVDFGKAAFGTIRFQATASENGQIVSVHLGEVIAADERSINREPGGSRRYREMQQPLKRGTHWYEVVITPDERNTKPRAIHMPKEVGEVMPFRYCELEGYPGKLKASDIKQIRVHHPFNDDAAHFASSSKVLNDVWELCKYSIKATSFTGVYVDGDRERIPYEGDAYINQLAHYCLDTEYAMARISMDYLMKHPTWPVEWHQHMPLMAWEEYLYTGNADFIRENYDVLVAKMLQPLARQDELLVVNEKRMTRDFLKSIGMKRSIKTLVDWPVGERDGHVIRPVDSVVNAFYYRNLILMSRMAKAVDKLADAKRFRQTADRVFSSYQKVFFNGERGIYRDGAGANHSSLHSNLFPLAFGLVPEGKQAKVLAFIESRGMACSVYAAQHSLDGLYEAGAGDYAFSLLTSTEERSWAHMIYGVGSTITLEAWDDRFKPNQDWNHAWGAAPANLIPRRLMGITPVEPGFRRARVQPQLGALQSASIKYPTLLGAIELDIEQQGGSYTGTLTIPEGMTADFILPGKKAIVELQAGTHSF